MPRQGGVGFGDTTYARTDDLHFTSSVDSFSKESEIASTEPCTLPSGRYSLRELRLRSCWRTFLEFRFLLTRQFNFAEFTLT